MVYISTIDIHHLGDGGYILITEKNMMGKGGACGVFVRQRKRPANLQAAFRIS